MKQPLLGLTLTELQMVVKNLGLPGFAAKQIAAWLYDKKVASIDEMTNLSLRHRALLKEIYEVGCEVPERDIMLKPFTFRMKIGLRCVYLPRWDVR